MVLSRKQVKKIKPSWYRAWTRMPHPTFLAFGSLLLIGFARFDSASPSTAVPLSITVIKDSQETPNLQVSANLSSPNQAWSYFHPSWEKRSFWNLLSENKDSSDPMVDSSWDAKLLVEDPKERVENAFTVPQSLKDRVVFWINIYANYTSQMRVVHDRHNMGIIYGYLDFRPLYRESANRAVAIIKSNEIEKKVLKELKLRLQAAANTTDSKSEKLYSQERQEWREILSRSGALSHKDTSLLIQTIRTQSGQSDMFLSALHRSKHLLPHIESVFKQNALPAALARIPFVESSFNTEALSKIGAMGIWQFTPETAKEMIRSADEKNWADPLYQTRSAARLLRMYRNILPDWGMAITSYNSGVGRVRRIAKRYGYTKADELINSPQSEGLGFAGKNFYSEFLAANIVEAYKDEIFTHFANATDLTLIFKGKPLFPNQTCDL